MSSFRRALLSAVGAVPVLLVLWAPGCAKQGEGERCDFNNSGHDDCEIGLECVPGDLLIDHSTDRCCPPEGTDVTDEHCLRSTGVGGSGGSDGGKPDGSTGGSDSGTGGSDSGTGGTGEAGVECHYDSECDGTLVCGPTGVCQVECAAPKDCSGGKTCVNGTCVPPSDAGQD